MEVRRRGCRHGRGAGLSAVLGGMSAGIELCPIAAAEPYSLAAGAAWCETIEAVEPVEIDSVAGKERLSGWTLHGRHLS